MELADAPSEFYCVRCHERGTFTLLRSEKFPEAEKGIRCGQCNSIQEVRRIGVRAPSGKWYRVVIPQASQPVDTHFRDGPCGSDEAAVATHPEEDSFHVALASGLSTSRAEPFYDVTEGEKRARTTPPLLFLITAGVGSLLQRLCHRVSPQSRFPVYWKRLGEIIGAFGIGVLCASVVPALIYWGLGVPSLPLYREMVWSFVVGGAVYFALLMARELIITTGELQLILERHQQFRLHTTLRLAFSNWVFLLGLAALSLIFFMVESLVGNPPLIVLGHTFAVWLWGIPMVLIGQVLVAYGVLNYALYSGVRSRYPVTYFRRGYLAVSQTIDDLGVAEAYIVLFLAGAFVLFQVVIPQLTGVAPYEAYPPRVAVMLHSLGLFVIVVTLLAYFLYLSKFVSDLKSPELRKLDEDIASAWRADDPVTAKSLVDRKSELKATSRWIWGIGLSSRLLLIVFLGLQTVLLGSP